jgi:hypothetical protein
MDKRDRSLEVSRAIYTNLEKNLNKLNSTLDLNSCHDNLDLLIPSNNQRYLLYISTFQNTLYYYFYSIKDEFECIHNTDFCIKGKYTKNSPPQESIYYGVLFKTTSDKMSFLISDVLLLNSQVLDTLPFNQRYSTLLKFASEQNSLFSCHLNSKIKVRLSPLFSTSKLSLHKTMFKYSNQCTHVLSPSNILLVKQNFSLDWINHTSQFYIKSTDYGNIYDIYSITTREYIGKIYIPIDKQLYLQEVVTCKFNSTFQKWTLASPIKSL